MKVTKTNIEGLLVFEPRVFKDDRGSFYESFNFKQFNDAVGEEINFLQDNQSKSRGGVLRGLHFQNPPHAQGKLVRVTKGSAIDVAVDIRKSSPTYGEYFSVLLNSESNKQLWIPPGFAHGFMSIEDDTTFLYKCTNYYAPESEGTIMWDDADLNIDWGIDDALISDKDKLGVKFKNFISSFE